MVNTWLAAHRGQVADEVWRKRRDEWSYDVSERGWRRLLSDISKGKSEDCIYLALDKDKIVGLVNGYVTPSSKLTGEVGSLYVKPSHQGKGMGRQLLSKVAAHLAQLGMTELRLSVLASNVAAQRFYETLGGRVIGERESEDYGVKQLELIYSWQPIQLLISGLGKGHRS